MELKQLPNGGSQKEQRDRVWLIVTVGWLISLICLKMGWFTQAELQAFGVTFQNWWIVTGITGGIYAHGENGRKKADALMNQ